MGLIPPLAIIQARFQSTRLSTKMFRLLGDKPLIRWATDAAIGAFGSENTVVAVPLSDRVMFEQVLGMRVEVFAWDGGENDVLGRLHACASHYRSDPTCPMWRITPDDWPPVVDRDLTTLAQLKTWHETVTDPYLREHVGYLFHPDMPVEINTAEDLAYAERRLAGTAGWRQSATELRGQIR